MGHMLDERIPEHFKRSLERFDPDLFVEYTGSLGEFVIYQKTRTAWRIDDARHPVLFLGGDPSVFDNGGSDRIMVSLYEQRFDSRRPVWDRRQRQIKRIKEQQKARDGLAQAELDAALPEALDRTFWDPVVRNQTGMAPRTFVPRNLPG